VVKVGGGDGFRPQISYGEFGARKLVNNVLKQQPGIDWRAEVSHVATKNRIEICD
jgi:hypothetical protein